MNRYVGMPQTTGADLPTLFRTQEHVDSFSTITDRETGEREAGRTLQN
jgi:hypothetical protein